VAYFVEQGVPGLSLQPRTEACFNSNAVRNVLGGGRKMAKFGRFEFGKEKPAEIYDQGDYMELDDKGFVRIFSGKLSVLQSLDTPPRLVNAIHLDKGQSVREISELTKQA
jgi:hypothetical protein